MHTLCWNTLNVSPKESICDVIYLAFRAPECDVLYLAFRAPGLLFLLDISVGFCCVFCLVKPARYCYLEFDNVPPTVTPEDKGDVSMERTTCDSHGETYQDGDMFPSNRTALQPTKDNQCVMCVCSVRTLVQIRSKRKNVTMWLMHEAAHRT